MFIFSQDIEVVINYDFPLGASGIESYVHRIGRTARAHNKGSAYTFFTQRDGRMAAELSALLVRCRQVYISYCDKIRMISFVLNGAKFREKSSFSTNF